MPHKHVRKTGNDARDFDLPPSALAKALPTFAGKVTKGNTAKPKQKNHGNQKKAVKSRSGVDDTPKAFARMLAHQSSKRPSNGLDDGQPRRKKAKFSAVETSNAVSDEPAGEVPKIQPGEHLSDFAARVNHAIPLSGLAKRRHVKIEGVKERRTKTEKRLQKMYADWREEEARIHAKNEELTEQAEEQDEELAAAYGGQTVRLPESRNAKRRRTIGETGEMNDDPWAVLKTKREAPKGLHDVVQAPPELKVIPKDKFNVRHGAKVSVANVPNSVGSLKKREELSEARQEVISRYRAMMKNHT